MKIIISSIILAIMSNYTLITVAVNPSLFRDVVDNVDVSDIFFIIVLAIIAVVTAFPKKQDNQA